MNRLLRASSSPHIYGSTDTRGIMRDVLIALAPVSVAAMILYGFHAALLIAVTVASAVVGEWLFCILCKRPNTTGDLSAAVTGLLLALNLPASMPLWQAMLGALIAVIAVKGLFGGIGQNFANPAITARIVLLISFTASATRSVFPTVLGYADTAIDGITGATPLAILAKGSTDGLPSVLDMLIGMRGGAIGEGCILALLAGGIYLLVRRVISWHTPVAFIGCVFLISLAVSGDPMFALYEILSGGLVIGAFFMATDYTTTPSTHMGQFLFGLGCGLITLVIRLFSSAYPEGVSFSILLMNILTPYIDRLTLKKPLGGIRK